MPTPPTHEWDYLTKEEMWNMIQSIRVLTDNDGTISPEAGVEWLIADRDSWHELASKLEAKVKRLQDGLKSVRREYMRAPFDETEFFHVLAITLFGSMEVDIDD
jgi:hypothetical protein